MNIEKGDKVITPNGQGEVIDDKVYNGIFSVFSDPQVKVKLDPSGKEKDFSQEDLKLQAKKPSPKEAIEAVDKIKEQLNKIPNMPTREKGELPNHLEYFKQDIQVDNELRKQLGLANLDYVAKTLETLKKTDSTANCWQEIESNLKILRWWTRAK
ncbi:hypothetical protein VF14_27785 [Nostoc linckia z18]|uniref:Uncharacterized protein n=2 Tax=Nostoc linckia TaxID=92942 RepID=A0A9Q5ZC14_NOSLI|nr:hypothetical protein [Nostoc linckia]PHJ66970.1 hypothetical protein VF02_06560 [Nostoc linckia z1]PHJ67700.1 hypothetical protein VF05_16885 [Nostoc linckia z3]PHJ77232.1 hypothetical protein VF03_05120 [Nostoc linckia z2]PHJ79817.1 hypothetical protein VF06_24660 [Nostoc linckia z4]PHJ87411.1 hypothetical protein VF07_20400 [Nostoc linckia z6]